MSTHYSGPRRHSARALSFRGLAVRFDAVAAVAATSVSMTGPNPADARLPMRLRSRTAIAIAVFALSLLAILATGRQRGDFRIDEAHKLSETYYLRLVERGDFDNPDWFRSRVERSNPPAGKYLFGLAIRAAGLELPRDLTVAEVVNSGQRYPPPSALPAYRKMLVPARLFTAAITAATAATIFLAGCSAAGFPAGAVATILYATSFMTQTFAATAVFDPLLTFAVLLPLLPISRIENSSWRSAAWLMAAAGAMAGVAAQVRVNGLIALAGIIAAALCDAVYSGRLRRAVALCCIASAACLTVATLVNPYYWSNPSASAVPSPFRGYESLPVRIVDRYRIQFADLRFLLAREEAAQTALRGIEKPRFVAEYLFGDWFGIAMLFGLALAVAVPIATRRLGRPAAIPIAWSAVIIVILTAWLPLPYPRYVLLAVPPAALVAGYGWSALGRSLMELLRAGAGRLP
jgi:hypothetical protein